MKNLILVLFLLVFSCSEDEEDPRSGIGCQTGILKSGGTDRDLIRCCTFQEFLAGDNVNAGGTSRAKYYKDMKWEKCADCN